MELEEAQWDFFIPQTAFTAVLKYYCRGSSGFSFTISRLGRGWTGCGPGGGPPTFVHRYSKR